jgi:phosphoribosyl 1,2-cyclic phosphodiesterase
VFARIWGCRGSLATPGRDTLRYGGNTSCVEVVLDDGTLIILDAGTGIRGLGLTLRDRPPCTIHVLLTHLHLDHVEGLAFFGPVWRPETEMHIWGPPSQRWSLEERLARYFSPPLFPIALSEVPSRLTFHDVPEDEWQVGGARVSAVPVSHPGPTVGYRLEVDGLSLAYIPDHEPVVGGGLRGRSPDWLSGHAVAAAATVLVHDSQYSEEEYATKMGWGHPSVADAVEYAHIVGAERLVLFHHDPLHRDEELEALEGRAVELWEADGPPPELAREGMEISLAAWAATTS